MKKILFVLLFLFLSINVFSQDIVGHWVAEYTMLDDSEGRIEVEFFESTVIFHYEDSNSAEFSYHFEQTRHSSSGVMMFMAEAGYVYEKISENAFRLIPAHGSDVEEIIFTRA